MEKVFNVLSYGAKADGQTLNSAAVQSAIDDCAKNGGGVVYFPAGEYVLSTVFLKSGVKIFIEAGAVVLGSLDFYDYAPQEPIDYPAYQDQSHTYFHCSMFVGIDCDDIGIYGEGTIDMRSVWDEDNVRDIVHRGPKCIALKNCKNVEIYSLTILNVTDLAVYFAGCENVDIYGLKLRVYIDGISPDNSKNVRIHDCDLETGDDGIVFKSSYTLNRLDICKDIHVWNCRVKSRCNAVKFGTETNGGFEDILIENVDIRETRISGIAIESVDGAIIDGVTLRNITMKNVDAPIFVHVGTRMRGPVGREVGEIKNITLENITVEGPYEAYDVMAWNYISFKKGDFRQDPRKYFPKSVEGVSGEDVWQMSSNICGLKDRPLKNIILRNVRLLVNGGVDEYKKEVPEEAQDYPEAYVYGWILPAKGIYFRHIDGLTLDNVTVVTYRADAREDFVFESVTDLKKA